MRRLLEIFSAMAMAVAITVFLAPLWYKAQDNRPIKLEQFYPDEKGAEKAIYRLVPKGAHLDQLLITMQRSEIKSTTAVAIRELHRRRFPGDNKILFFKTEWQDRSRKVTVYAYVYADYDANDQITNIRVNYSELEWRTIP